MLFALIIFALNFEIYDFIIVLTFFIFVIALLTLSLILTIEEKSGGLSMILHSVITVIYLLVTLFNIFFIIPLILNIMSIFSYRHNFKVKPTFKSKNSKKFMYLLIIFLFLPIISSLLLDYIGPQITIPARNANVDINFYIEFEHKYRLGVLDMPIYTNSSPLSDDVLGNLSYWNNNLTNINVSISLAVHESQLSVDNSSAINYTRRFNSSGISVDAWLLLKEADGYWPNDLNALQFFSLYNESFRDWRTNYSLQYRNLVIDAESLHFSTFQLALQEIITIPFTYWSNQHGAAIEIYNQLISTVKNDSLGIGITSYQFVIPEDLYDGDDSLQRILDISYYPPYGFDFYSIMGYSQGVGSEYGVYLNAKMMDRYFGNKPNKTTSVIINVVRESLPSIVKKVHILRNMGVELISIYSLEGFLDTLPNGLADLNQFFQDIKTPETVSVTYASIQVFYGLQVHVLVRYLIFCLDWWIFWFDLPIS